MKSQCLSDHFSDLFQRHLAIALQSLSNILLGLHYNPVLLLNFFNKQDINLNFDKNFNIIKFVIKLSNTVLRI